MQKEEAEMVAKIASGAEQRWLEGARDTGQIERVAERSERRMTPRGNLGATSMYHGSYRK